MRVLISSVPGYGHLHPLLPLAVALREAGHSVAIATGPDLRGRAERFGFEAFGVGSTISEAFRQLAVRFPNGEYNRLTPDEILGWYLPHLFGEVLAPAVLVDLEPLLGAWAPDLVLHDSWEFAAPVAAAAAGIPSVSQTLGLRYSRTLLDAVAESVAPLWAARSLEPDPTAGLYRHLCLDITPPGLQPRVETEELAAIAPMRPVPPPLLPEEAAPDWLRRRDPSRPLLYMTLGTNTNSDRRMFTDILDGLADLSLDLLITTGPESRPELLGSMPSNVHVEAYVAQSLVLPESAAVICHGGAGTTLGALALGIPLVVVPQGADQYAIAERVARSGAGLRLDPGQITPASIRAAVECVLETPGPRQAARQLRDEINGMPDPRATTARLGELFSGRGPLEEDVVASSGASRGRQAARSSR